MSSNNYYTTDIQKKDVEFVGFNKTAMNYIPGWFNNLKVAIASSEGYFPFQYMIQKLPEGTETALKVDKVHNEIRLISKSEAGFSCNNVSDMLIPTINDVKVYGNVVIVQFNDGTEEKAVTNGEDQFSLEQGVSICITKKLLSGMTSGHGHEAYNKLVNYAMRVYNKNRSAEKKAKAEAEHEAKRIEHKIAKLKAKKEKRLAAKRAAEREEAISIQTEAYLRAMRQLEQEKN